MLLADFKLRVGQRLAVVPVSGSLSAEDGALIEQTYNLLVKELVSHDLAWWNEEEPIPDEYADIMVGMTAAKLVDEFTIPEPRRGLILQQSAFGMPVATPDERRLRRLTAIPPDDRSGPPDDF